MIHFLRDLFTGTTRLTIGKFDLWDAGTWSEIDVTKCCGIGPVTDENYCSKCGRRILI